MRMVSRSSFAILIPLYVKKTQYQNAKQANSTQAHDTVTSQSMCRLIRASLVLIVRQLAVIVKKIMRCAVWYYATLSASTSTGDSVSPSPYFALACASA